MRGPRSFARVAFRPAIVATIVLGAAMACAGKAAAPSGPPATLACPDAITPGAECPSPRMACAYAGDCTGCICGDDKTWVCPSTPTPPAQCCPREALLMPCDTGDGNACGGLCWPDATGVTRMYCVPANPVMPWLQGGQTLDGVACSPGGLPASDCSHSCQGGTCVPSAATGGTACIPAGDYPPAPALPSICDGVCDGKGGCVATGAPPPGCLLGGCSYGGCNPWNLHCFEINAPAGLACTPIFSTCVTGTCNATGVCSNPNHIPGCSPPAPEQPEE